MVALLVASGAGCGRPLRFPLTAGASFEFSAYYQNDISGTARPVLTGERDLIRTVYPVWYEVDAAGRVTDIGFDDDIKRVADAAGIAVVPVVRNRSGPADDPAAALRKGAAAAVVERLRNLVRDHDFAGLNIDFAGLPGDMGDELLAFARDLWRAMHALGKRLVITVPALPDRKPAETAAYNYRQLSRVADFIVLAAYDNHSSQTAPGPIAPLSWVNRSIDQALRVIPAGKVILAVVAYGYDWPAGGPGLAATTSAAAAYELAREVGAAVGWDEDAHEATFSYSEAGAHRTVWFGDRRSVAERVALARRRGLYGVAYWRLGQEEPGFWGSVEPAARGR
ncbi:MAG: glycosyl hydrolase family 18 protein [Chloroflexota bacterium]